MKKWYERIAFATFVALMLLILPGPINPLAQVLPLIDYAFNHYAYAAEQIEDRSVTQEPVLISTGYLGTEFPFEITEEEEYYQVTSQLASVRFYDYYTEVWNRDFTEVQVYDDRWTVEYLNKQDKWTDSSFWDVVRSYEVTDDAIIVRRTGQTTIGERTETYTFRNGDPCKINITQNTIEEQTIRYIWTPSGIVSPNETQTVDGFTFPSGLSIDWADAASDTPIITPTVESHAQGRKLTVVFEEFLVVAGSSHTLDPRYEYHTAGDDTYSNIYTPFWKWNSFTNATTFYITSVHFKIRRVGSPGPIWASVRATDPATGKPTGANLTVSTTFLNGDNLSEDDAGVWYDLAVSPVALTGGTTYCFILWGGIDVNNGIRWRYDTGGGNGLLMAPGGTADGGVSWTIWAGDSHLFEVWGYPVGAEVTTTNATFIEEYHATINEDFVATNNAYISCEGFVWDNSSQPWPDWNSTATSGYTWTLEDNGIFGNTSYSWNVTGLSPGQVMYYRGVVRGDLGGWSYGTELSFLTKPLETTALNATNVPNGDCNLLSWTAGVGSTLTMVRYSTLAYPTNTTDGSLAYFGAAASYNHSSLVRGSTYYYSAFSYVSGGMWWQWADAYDTGFALVEGTATVTTQAATNVTQTSADLHGTVTMTGGSDITSRGMEWRVIPGGYPWNWSEAGIFGAAAYSHTEGTFVASTTYYYRAFAANVHGTAYGTEVSFTTQAAPPPPPGGGVEGITRYNLNTVHVNWTVDNATYTGYYIRCDTDGWPDDQNTGWTMYYGLSGNESISGLTLDYLDYYFIIYGNNIAGNTSVLEGQIGGEKVQEIALFAGTMVLGLALLIASFRWRDILLSVSTAVVWMGIGFWWLNGGVSFLDLDETGTIFLLIVPFALGFVALLRLMNTEIRMEDGGRRSWTEWGSRPKTKSQSSYDAYREQLRTRLGKRRRR